MGHCIESGYGLVDESGQLQLVGSEGTAPVLEAIRRSPRDRGIRLRVHRRREGEEMHTTSAETVDA